MRVCDTLRLSSLAFCIYSIFAGKCWPLHTTRHTIKTIFVPKIICQSSFEVFNFFLIICGCLYISSQFYFIILLFLCIFCVVCCIFISIDNLIIKRFYYYLNKAFMWFKKNLFNKNGYELRIFTVFKIFMIHNYIILVETSV